MFELLHKRGATTFQHKANVATHAYPAETAGLRAFRPHRSHAFLYVGDSANISKEYILNTGANRSYRQVGARLLLDFHHAAHVEQINGAAKVLERKEIIRRVFANEFDVVEAPAVADQLDHGRPRIVNV